ncbi:sugar transferase [Mucilaginibacter lappiensis]|uniref:Lipopolysaccharide/colanic/teichoic acid biosynthesis glycosyltransferase n=1 Tax=Mucilaginibacter lappiensis TaxID=354630 RepID=A0A841JPV7_9SPHI|nr:sugar transferase [Mucilaginibacter lappiensis]MBB6131636.1 lipopolysaccharide/colanic/teichoic acid biosynthesis glycosyltransferase [Mucilaginibacter lappiensis]
MSANPELSFKVIFFKRSFDILFSVSVMIVGFPIFLLLMLITKMTSKGPSFYKQEWIGRNHKPFTIYKFRSMYINAEKAGPQLSAEWARA